MSAYEILMLVMSLLMLLAYSIQTMIAVLAFLEKRKQGK